MKRFLITLFLGCLFTSLFCQKEITLHGKIISKENKQPLQYATIQDITTSQNGTISGRDGTFSLVITDAELDDELLISYLGHHTEIITAREMSTGSPMIALKEKKYELPEITITKGKLKEQVLGIPCGKINKDLSGKDMGTFPNKKGFGSGLFVRVKKKGEGILKSLDVYITDLGFPETPFMIRVLMPQNIKMKSEYNYPEEDFIDLVKEPIIYQGEAGWNHIDLSSYNIPIPSGDFLILFMPVALDDKYKWNDGHADWYGMVIGEYKKEKVPGLHLLVQWDGTFVYFNIPLQSDGVPAVVVRYLCGKN